MWRVVVLGMAAVFLTACGGSGSLVIGVRAGQPGLVDKLPGGGWAGFDIAVAHYVARELGYRDDQIRYTFDAGEADLSLGAVGGRYAGPYLVTTKDLLVRTQELRTLRALRSARVCGTRADVAPLVERFGTTWQNVFVAEANVPAACGPLLADRRIDAIIADAPVLAGISAQYPGRFRFLGRDLAEVRYGIRLAPNAIGLRDDVEEALRTMYEDGSWHRAVIDYLGLLATRYLSPPVLEKG
ncbi:glutamate ABC transporter substrate-binding protein [Acrocarpospora macrocephala]|uniref:Glutamate-binding protein n=1 Tax=Acrocarpospora macrocephala TaxID=150177 RepID=A0A5M3X146_9ACTN|nr:transporter substrate-binding domain-containing protein [Acrocarpospora macrocephala]GES15435.1 glutamate-binding protein [Acrocarpospora macrocephala]